MKKIFIIVLIVFLINPMTKADEGMWIPMLLQGKNIEEMQKKGLKLSADDIYSINQSSLKDAVVIFGGGCTGELVSDSGLLLSNHHCGYRWVQSHSSLTNDYLTNGFWAYRMEEELACPDLSVVFLVRMEDVSQRVLSVLNDKMDMKTRQFRIDSIVGVIEKEATADTSLRYTAKVKSFYAGNEYYLFVSQVFKDVRMVGVPHSGIGKFGGDTDNWMWPRHTGDFSYFRVYADSLNRPAAYSPKNKPYKPKRSLIVNIKGVKKGDFTMVMGYPGRTQQFMTSYGVKLIQEVENPHQIKIRQIKIDIMGRAINASREVRIKYSSKYADIANYWKKWIGENRGLKQLNTIQKKQELEKRFQTWAESDTSRNAYKDLLGIYEKSYTSITPYTLAGDYFYEAGYSLDIIQFMQRFRKLTELSKDTKTEDLGKMKENLLKHCDNFYKNYDAKTDIEIFAAMAQLWYDKLDSTWYPEILKKIANTNTKSIKEYVLEGCKQSIFTQPELFKNFIRNYTYDQSDTLKSDFIYLWNESLLQLYYYKIAPGEDYYNATIDSLNRLYVKGMREMRKNERVYPDANFTLRVAYGTINDYQPSDAKEYDWYTTIEGIMEKIDSTVYDYNVPSKLIDLYNKKDYGIYGKNGQLNVCFIASNHTTGGNSGSPVLNAEGHLIGVNFDRSWESTMSDLEYSPERCRNIAVDIRYVLFITDKLAGATRLVKEMKIVQ